MRLFDYSITFAIIYSCNGQSEIFCKKHKSSYLCSEDDPFTPQPVCQALDPPVKAGFQLGNETDQIVKDINEFRKKWVEGNLAIQNSKYRYGRKVLLMKWSGSLQKQAQIQATYCSKVSPLPTNLETEYPPGFSMFTKHVEGGQSKADELWDKFFKEKSEKEVDKFKNGGEPKPDDLVFLGKFHLIGCGIMSVAIKKETTTISTTLVCHLVHGPLSNKLPLEEGISNGNCIEQDCPEHTSCSKLEYKNLFCELDGSGNLKINISILSALVFLLWIVK